MDITADIYLRLSDLRLSDVDEHGETTLTAKEKLLRERAATYGWKIGRVLVENDMTDGKPRPASAFKRRKVMTPGGKAEYRVWRPAFREALDRLASREAQALLAEDLDRTCRDPRDLEDLIDTCEMTGANARSLSGSLTLTDGGTDGEITMARVMVAMGNKSSRDTSRRVAQNRQTRAKAGRAGGGRRPYGFRSVNGARYVDEDEAKLIRQWADAVLADEDAASLKAIARDLREQEVPTVTGAAWSAETLKDILCKPMLGGISVHKGQEVDVPVEQQPAWMTDPILPTETWRAVRAKLTDPARRTNTSNANAVRWLGSGLYLCGKCGATMRVSGGTDRDPRYTCSASPHLARNAKILDEYVEDYIVAMLERPDAGALVAPAGPDVDAPALRRELAVHQARLSEIAADYDNDLVTRSQFLTQTASRRSKIARIDEQLTKAVRVDPLAGIAGNPDAETLWQKMSLEEKRNVLRRTLTVTVLPAGRRGQGFDPASVRIENAAPVR